MNMQEHPQRAGWFQSKRTTLILLGFVAVGAFFLLTEHTAHVLGVLPFLIFLLCPLMMLFMHAGTVGTGDRAVMVRTGNNPRREEDNEHRQTHLPMASGPSWSSTRWSSSSSRLALRTRARAGIGAPLARSRPSCGALYRDVRLSLDHLPAVRMAGQRVPWCQPAFAQYGTPLGNADGLER